MVEFATAALPLLVAGLLVVEAARWHVVRQILNLALLDAARAGATAHARPQVIDDAFEHGLLPLFVPPGQHRSAHARMRADLLEVTRRTGLLPWRIDILAPSGTAYADFGDAALRVDGARGLPVINNDYQAEQHARRRSQGWHDGRGPLSGQTIFEANTLRLRLTYIHAPLVPAVRAVLRAIGAAAPMDQAALRAGMLTMVMEMALPMQSHPVHWPAPQGSYRAARAALGTADPRTRRPGQQDGRWAPFAAPVGAGSERRLPTAPAPRAWPPPQASVAPTVASRLTAPGPAGDAASDLHPAACGVLLCCVE
ncbi:TadE family protein [Bordetella flabilis]